MQDIQYQAEFPALSRKKARTGPASPPTRADRGHHAGVVGWISVFAAFLLLALGSGGIARASTMGGGLEKDAKAVCAQSPVIGCVAALVKAERRWPGARVMLTPRQLPPGDYLVPDTGGQFAQLVVRMSV